MRLSRRTLLRTALASGGAVTLGGVIHQPEARAQQSDPRLLLMVGFAGGWDQLLALDPRPHDDPKYQQGGGTGIVAGYDIFQNNQVESVLAGNPSGVQTRGNLTFGPVIPESFLQHSSDVSIIRGLMMDTLNHEAGRRYFNTGQFPVGVVAKGSSLTTHVAAQAGLDRAIPNLTIRAEGYNRDQVAEASPIYVTRPSDVNTVLLQLGTKFPAAVTDVVRGHEDGESRCELDAYNGDGKVALMQSSRRKVFSMLESNVASAFDFKLGSTDPEIQNVLSAFEIGSNEDINGIKGRAALAGQALARGISQGVSFTAGAGLDTHDSSAPIVQPRVLAIGFEALGLLISFLKNQQFGETQESVWSYTTLCVSSEFARTPRYKVGGGRDHHLASSCLVAGPGIVGDRVIGATSDQKMAVMPINPATGETTDEADPAGKVIRPADVHATLLESMGLSRGHLDNVTPQVIDALIA